MKEPPKPVVIDEATCAWEAWDDPAVAAKSRIRWKVLVAGERIGSRELVLGLVEIPPGEVLLPHHHAPAETYYVLRGCGDLRIDDLSRTVAPGMAVYIPADAPHTVRATGAEPLTLIFNFARDRFHEIAYHFDVDW